MASEDGQGAALVTMGRRREVPWFQLFHELVDLYGERIGGFAGIGYWATLRRYVNHDETNPWRGHAFPSRRRLCATGRVGTDKLQELRDLCVAWGLLDVSLARQRRFAGGQFVSETRRLLYKVNDPLTAEEFHAAVVSGALPRAVEPPEIEDVPAERGDIGFDAGVGGMDLCRSMPERQGMEGTDLSRTMRTDLDGSVNRKNQEQKEKTAAGGPPAAHAHEDPPAPAGSREAPGVAAAATAVAACSIDQTGSPEQGTGTLDLDAVCGRYAAITGRSDLTPEQVREAAGERAAEAGYLERTLDWLGRRMREGSVHNPRGLYLQALKRRWADETPPPDGPGTGGGHRAERPRGSTVAGVAAPPAHAASESVPAVDPGLLARLTEVGVTQRVATDLVRSNAEECERQLQWLPYRSAKDPAATLVRAIRERWGEPPAVAEERRVEREREQTRKLFAEMDEDERAAQDPDAHARGLAALAEMRAMLQHKCGRATDPPVPEAPEANPTDPPPTGPTMEANAPVPTSPDCETAAPAGEGTPCASETSGTTSNPSSISETENRSATKPSSGQGAAPPERSSPPSTRRETVPAGRSTSPLSRQPAGLRRLGSVAAACLSTLPPPRSHPSPPARAGPPPRTG